MCYHEDVDTYRIPARCHVCGKDFLARYNVAARAKTCTPPDHKCDLGEVNGRKVRCTAKCCRSRYSKAAVAAHMDAAIDSRKVLSEIEYALVLADIRKLTRPERSVLWFISETGCRLGEAFLVRVGDFQFTGGPLSVVRVPTLKREGRPVRSVHIDNEDKSFAKELREILNGRDNSEPVFLGTSRRTVQGTLEAILDIRKPDREGLVHILRHTRASRLIAAGMDLNYVRGQLGWSSIEMVRIYAHTQESAVVSGLAKMRTSKSSK